MPPRSRPGTTRAAPRTPGSGRAFEKALEAGFSIGVGFVLGYYIDVWLETKPIFLFVFSIAGLVACVRVLMSIQWAPAPAADTSGEPQVGEPRAGEGEEAHPPGGGIDPRHGDR